MNRVRVKIVNSVGGLKLANWRCRARQRIEQGGGEDSKQSHLVKTGEQEV